MDRLRRETDEIRRRTDGVRGDAKMDERHRWPTIDATEERATTKLANLSIYVSVIVLINRSSDTFSSVPSQQYHSAQQSTYFSLFLSLSLSLYSWSVLLLLSK